MTAFAISGHICTAGTEGSYTCPNCGEGLSIKRGQVFPNCSRDKSAVRWLWVKKDKTKEEPPDSWDDDDDDDD